jgi:hypothetical protein
MCEGRTFAKNNFINMRKTYSQVRKVLEEL